MCTVDLRPLSFRIILYFLSGLCSANKSPLSRAHLSVPWADALCHEKPTLYWTSKTFPLIGYSFVFSFLQVYYTPAAQAMQAFCAFLFPIISESYKIITNKNNILIKNSYWFTISLMKIFWKLLLLLASLIVFSSIWPYL